MSTTTNIEDIESTQTADQQPVADNTDRTPVYTAQLVRSSSSRTRPEPPVPNLNRASSSWSERHPRTENLTASQRAFCLSEWVDTHRELIRNSDQGVNRVSNANTNNDAHKDPSINSNIHRDSSANSNQREFLSNNEQMESNSTDNTQLTVHDNALRHHQPMNERGERVLRTVNVEPCMTHAPSEEELEAVLQIEDAIADAMLEEVMDSPQLRSVPLDSPQLRSVALRSITITRIPSGSEPSPAL